MSISVGFTTSSKRLNSTRQLTMTDTKECVLKNGCSMLNPVLLLELSSSNFPAYTGFKIGDRYYNVTDIRSVRNNLFEVSGEVDVLATYKTNIGSASEYVLRSASAHDGNIVDGKYPSKSAPTGQYYEPVTINSTFNDTGTFIIGMKNGEGSSGLTFYAVSPTQMTILVAYMFSDVWLTASDVTVALQKMLVNPMDYLSVCFWVPFTMTTSGSNHVYFGYWDSGATGTKLNESSRVINVSDSIALANHPQIARGNYLNGSPYTRLTADIYGFGRIPLDANMFMQSRSLTIRILVDLFTGIGELAIESSVGRVAKASSMIGVPIQLSQVTQDLIKPIIASVGAGVSAARGNWVGGAAGILDGLMSCMPQVQTTGTTGSKITYTTSPRIYQEWYRIVDEDNATLGRPLCAVRTINTLSGYVLCENVDIDLPATATEKQKVINFMESGFFYE